MKKLTLMCILAATPVLAQDAALVLGNTRYVTLDQLIGADDVAGGANALAAVGFNVERAANATAEQMRTATQVFAGTVRSSDRIVVALSGQFATDGRRTWFLPVDAQSPTLFALDGALSVDSLLQLMNAAQGQAVLALGYDAAEDDAFDRILREGIGDLAIPQGVTVVLGEPDDISDFLKESVVPGADLAAMARENRGLQVQGYDPQSLILVPATAQVAPPPDTPVATADPDAEQALWDGARALDTADAYSNYLSRYPEGQFAEQATTLIEEITTEPNRPARLAEEALSLSRDQRRAVQTNLTVLNFDPRGIDGIFGSGSRSAIVNWQQQNGYPQTSYLNTEQINRLEAQAARRTAELEAETERARQEQLRQDKAFWDETGAQGDVPGLDAYLERYPQGTYASQARDLLAAIAEATLAEDNAAWEAAQTAATLEAFEAYLAAFPDGANTPQARAEIRALQSPEDVADEIAGETALGLTAITLRLIEARLAEIGMEPGAVDGTFDALTREAIAAFQQDRSLDPTGYLDQQTITRLLAD